MRRLTRSERFGPLAALADELVLEWRPDSAQTQALIDWVGARDWHRDPRLHTVQCDRHEWAQAAGGQWPSSLDATESTISRGEAFTVARRARFESNWMPLLATVYAWGYGRSRLGRYRYGQIAALDNVDSVLANAVNVMDEKGPVAAYERLAGTVTGFGPAFFTKFLYFAADAKPTKNPSLILDARVAAACRSITHSMLRGAGVDSELARGLARWQWGKGSWTPHRYGVYLDFAAGLTAHLEAQGREKWPEETPDAVELALFDRELFRTGTWS